MSYGKKYQCDYTDKDNVAHKIEFYLKDYIGDTTAVVGLKSPFVQTWSTDDPTAPIRGCSAEIQLVNKNGALPLSTFFSTEDNSWMVKHYRVADLTFIGFLVQDDFEEILVDYTHGIKLSATDNLGLLKEIPINECEKLKSLFLYSTTTTVRFDANHRIYFTLPIPGKLKKGDIIEIVGSTQPGTYEVLDSNIVYVTVREFVTTTGVQALTSLTVYRKQIKGKYTVAEYLKFILNSTNLNLNTIVYDSVYPVGGLNSHWLEDCLLDSDSFASSGSYKDCYEILKIILERFRSTIFQANGIWNMVRWDELRAHSGGIPITEYDSDFTRLATVGSLSDTFLLGATQTTFPENGITQSLTRPYKFTKETFKFNQTFDILRNGNFERLGALINQFTSGSNEVYEYEMLDWDAGLGYNLAGTTLTPSTSLRFIRVVKNSFDEEIERYGVIKGASGFDDRICAQSYPIEVNKGDRLRYSFDFRTKFPNDSSRYWIMPIITTSPATPRSLNNRQLLSDGSWQYNGSISYYVSPSGDDYNDWHTITVESEEIPVSGVMYVMLAQIDLTTSPARETHYRNLKIDMAWSSLGKGAKLQTHTDSQRSNINNKQDSEIYIDCSPSSTIGGTIFLNSLTGPIRNRALYFRRAASMRNYILGELTTIDKLYQRRIERIKLEGTLFNLNQSTNITPLTIVNYDYFSGLNFLLGRCEIDFYNKSVKGTLYEWYKDTEVDSDLSEIYEFKYHYE